MGKIRAVRTAPDRSSFDEIGDIAAGPRRRRFSAALPGRRDPARGWQRDPSSVNVRLIESHEQKTSKSSWRKKEFRRGPLLPDSNSQAPSACPRLKDATDASARGPPPISCCPEPSQGAAQDAAFPAVTPRRPHRRLMPLPLCGQCCADTGQNVIQRSPPTVPARVCHLRSGHADSSPKRLP